LPNEAVDFVVERHPQLSKTQALRHLHRTLLKHHSGQLLNVPPKRTYQRRRERDKSKTAPEGNDTDEQEDDAGTTDDVETEEEEEEEESNKNPTLKSTRKQQLAALDQRIARLRSDLLDAEMKKERLLRIK
jgi:hypothetical protein